MIRLKKSVEKINAYFVNDIPYRVKLDANEGSNYLLKEGLKLDLDINLYPDSDSRLLREKMALYYGCSAQNIMTGNGSSDLINMVINAFCETGDRVVSFTPSFSMYRTYCDLCGAELVEVGAEADLTQNIDRLIEKSTEVKPKIVILCNPNNPTGYITESRDVVKLLEAVRDSLIIVDEAYMDFGEESSTGLIGKYENLIVMRTLSKAFGLAGLRVGAMISNEELIRYVWKVKVPYNINVLSQYAAVKALENIELVKSYVKNVAFLREKLICELKNLNFTVYPSGANFIFVKPPVDNLYEKLMDCGILIRKFVLKDEEYCRITVGTEEENKILAEEIKRIMGGGYEKQCSKQED